MHLPGGISALFIVGFIIVVIGNILHLIGVSTPEWSVNDSTGAYGLFQSCTGIGCYENDYTGQSSESDDRVRASAAMNVIGAIFGLASFTFAMIHLGMGCLGKDPSRAMPLGGGIFGIVAFIFILIGVAVWGGAVHDDKLNDVTDSWDIGYSFALSITGGILLLIGGILLIIGNIKSGSSDMQEAD